MWQDSNLRRLINPLIYSQLALPLAYTPSSVVNVLPFAGRILHAQSARLVNGGLERLLAVLAGQKSHNICGNLKSRASGAVLPGPYAWAASLGISHQAALHKHFITFV